jgi:hypothetical protein
MNQLHALYHRPVMRFRNDDTEGNLCIELSITTVETVIREDKPVQNYRTTVLTADREQLENLIRILSDAAHRTEALAATITINPKES